MSHIYWVYLSFHCFETNPLRLKEYSCIFGDCRFQVLFCSLHQKNRAFVENVCLTCVVTMTEGNLGLAQEGAFHRASRKCRQRFRKLYPWCRTRRRPCSGSLWNQVPASGGWNWESLTKTLAITMFLCVPSLCIYYVKSRFPLATLCLVHGEGRLSLATSWLAWQDWDVSFERSDVFFCRMCLLARSGKLWVYLMLCSAAICVC